MITSSASFGVLAFADYRSGAFGFEAQNSVANRMTFSPYFAEVEILQGTAHSAGDLLISDGAGIATWQK